MDAHHNKNVYPANSNKDNDLYAGYARAPCAQQSQTSQRQHYLPPYGMPVPISNNMPQQLMYNGQGQPMYNIMYGPQTMYRNQNSFPSNAFSQTIEPVPWAPESCVSNSEISSKDKYLKYDNKLKDTNGANCCINRMECPLPDMYKPVNKNFYYNKNTIMDPQWFYGSNYDNQKYNELPSCSQITNESAINECCNPRDPSKSVKSVKYCSIQKYPEPDPKLYMYPNKYDSHNDMYINQQYKTTSKDYPSCSQLSQTCNLYSSTSTCLEIDKKVLLDHCEPNPCDIILPPGIHQTYYTQSVSNCPVTLPPFDVPKIDDKTTEESNNGGGESDIVVEDSDEESDESEEIDKEDIQPCLVCNIATVGNQFYIITSKNLVTSFSQTIVSEKLKQIFGTLLSSSNNLCSTCMTLINTLDNLENQLSNVKQDLMEKYKNTIETLQLFIDKQNVKDDILATSNEKIEINKKCATHTKFKVKKICGLHSFKCRVCEKIFSLKKFYKYHMSKHKTKTSYLCERCGCNFVKHSNLLAHLRRHLNKFSIRCTFCKKGFIYESSLRQHKCVKNKINFFICHICGKSFKTGTNLKEHEHVCSGNLPYKCLNCDKCFPSTTKLKQHINLKHDQNYSETCEICGKGFVKHSDLKCHMLTHSQEKHYKCPICSKEYKTLSNLNQHAKKHDTKLPFTCNVCNKGFIRKESLEAHLNIHNGFKPFDCSICEKKFASQKNLDAHLKVHKGTTKKKTCTICGKQISHGLEDHMRTHSNIKEFECITCESKFMTKGALAKHRKRKHENNMDLEIM